MVSTIESGVPRPNRGEKLEFASYFPAITAALVGLVLSTVAFHVLNLNERDRVASDLRQRTERIAGAVRSSLSSELDVLSSIAAFFAASEEVTREEFVTFVRNGMYPHPVIEAVYWAPRVTRGSRAAFVARVSAESESEYEVGELDETGTVVRAGDRDVYFPIQFMVEVYGDGRRMGLDLASLDGAVAAMERARDSGRPAATKPVAALGPDDGAPRIWFFYPVYGESVRHETVGARREHLGGVLTSVYRVPDLIEALIPPNTTLDVTVLDPGLPGAERRLHRHAPSPSPAAASPDSAATFTFDVAGRRWQVVVRLTPGFVAERRTFQDWIAATAGVALTSTLVLYLIVSARRRREIEGLVDALSESNAMLEDEVAERRRAIDAVSEREQRLRGIMDNVADAIITIDEHGTIESFNAAAEHVFGYVADEVVGGKIDRLMPESHRSRHDGYIDRYLRTGRPKIIGRGPREVVGLRKDGSTFPLDLAVSEMRVGDTRLFIGIVRDISARKETERQLQHAHKMEAVGQLTGGIAHDFNNLLTVVIGNLQLLERRLGDDERLTRRVVAAYEAANRGAELTKRLLAFSRRQVLVAEVTDVNNLITGMRDMIDRSIGETIEVRLALVDDAWSTRIDASQLETAILNLAVNAGHAMPDGGRLIIETANVHLNEVYARQRSEVGAGDYVMVAISDTGGGIPPDVMARVFEPFFTTKEAGKGTGLGLSMVYGFVKQSGGHVEIYSEEGRGTTVKLYLPRHETEGAAQRREEDRDEVPRGNGETVLLVEDDNSVREVGHTLLDELGYRVVEAHDARSALATLEQRNDIDLVFTDIVMPGGMTGTDLAREIERHHPTIKVLFASGFSEGALDRDRQGENGIELVSKPFQKGPLARKLRRTLDT